MGKKVKFLLLADCRCGGTVYRKTLAQHPDISMPDAELLHPGGVLADGTKFSAPDRPTSHAGWRPWIDNIYEAHNGWHLQRYQIEIGHYAWAEIAKTTGLKVISLIRHNVIAQYKSWRLAYETKTWQHRPAGGLPRIKWDQDECDRTIRSWAAQRAYTDRVFRSVPVLHVSYEQIAFSFGNVIEDTLDFLDVSKIDLNPAFQRLPQVDYSDVFYRA